MLSENKMELQRKLLTICAGVYIFNALANVSNNHAKSRHVKHQTKLPDIMTCEHPLFYNHTSASTIWARNLDHIVQWSQLPQDKGYRERPLVTEKVLPALGPEELRRSIVSNMPSTDVSRILEIVERRYRDPSMPPLKILVIGGSVAWGQGCFAPRPINTFLCRWSNRLENLINNCLGFDAVRVYNAALGGTNTAIANIMLEFQLYLDKIGSEGADVIINGYSTNEMHFLSMQQAKGQEESLEAQIFALMQRFIRGTQTGVWESHQIPESQALKKQAYKRPTIIYLDDYLGNEQHGILETMKFNDVLYRLTRYYNIAAVSSADGVRSVVYANTREHTFSPLGWYGGANGQYKREVHPPPGGHIAMTYVLAFAMLSFITNYCSDIEQETPRPHVMGRTSVGGKESSCLPPYLDEKLQLHEISHKWKNSCNESFSSEENPSPSNSSSSTLSKNCMFAWMSGLGNTTTEESLQHLFAESNALHNVRGDWRPRKDHKKLGYSYIGSEVGQNDNETNVSENGRPGFHLTFNPGFNEGASVRIVFMYMKSYGPDWDGSVVKLSGIQKIANNIHHLLFEEHLYGYFQAHEPQISVSVTKRFSFVSPSDGSTEIRIEVIGGKQFKFTGMVIC